MKEKIKILLITNKSDITTDFIVKQLFAKRIPFYRLNTEDIGTSIQFHFNFNEKQYSVIDNSSNVEIDLLKIKSVYFRRPEIQNIDSALSLGEVNFIKSELIYSLEGLYQILRKAFWLNNVFNIRKAENKIYQLILASKLGLTIPNSLITNNQVHAYEFYKRNNNFCIIKPIKSGLVEGKEEEGVIFTNKVDLTKVDAAQIEPCPIYLQQLINKKGDVRVTIVGDEIFSAFIHSQDKFDSQIDWRKSSDSLIHSPLEIPEDISSKCFKLTKELKLNFAAIDFILDTENNYIFLEINPNGQWAWIEKRLNYPISEKITNILVEKSI